MIVHRLDGAALESLNLPVAREFVGDFAQSRLVGDAIDDLAQHVASFHCGRQPRIAAIADDDRGAVERLEAAIADGIETVGGEIFAAGVDVVDAEDERVGSDDVHGCFLQFAISWKD